MADLLEPMRFAGPIHYFRPERAGGMAVVDIPARLVPSLGGLKQQRARGTINGAEFASSVMPVGGGRLALNVSKAKVADLKVRGRAHVEAMGVPALAVALDAEPGIVEP